MIPDKLCKGSWEFDGDEKHSDVEEPTGRVGLVLLRRQGSGILGKSSKKFLPEFHKNFNRNFN